MKRLLVVLILLVIFSGLVFSADFGLLIDQKIEVQNNLFTYSPAFAPWFSWNGGQGLSVYVSGLLSLQYAKYKDNAGVSGWDPGLVPEVSRFSLSYRAGQNFSLEAGRVIYADALGITASGLFDGIRMETALPLGSLSAGLFYTGLLYKETAKIVMTLSDEADFAEKWAWDNFGAYPASKRVLAALRWDIPVGNFNNLSLEALAQFDLNGNDDALHSQYGEILFEMYPKNKLGIIFGVSFEAMENKDTDFTAALGALAGLKTGMPGSLNDGLNLTIKFSSGPWNDTFGVFTPINSYAQGAVFQSNFSGLGSVRADYEVRIIPSLFAGLAASYFVRTYHVPGEGYLYGGEIWASLAWQPFDDLRLNLGGGVFFPSLGNISSGDDAMWKISAGVSLSL